MNKYFASAVVIAGMFCTSTVHASVQHSVSPGETMANVGARYGLPYAVVQRANGLSTTGLKVGQFLVIPERYVVKSGDTLWLISQRFGISLNTIRAVNAKWDSYLSVGETLYLPTPLRSVIALSAADKDLLERLVSAESKGEPINGQTAVADVVLNRVRSGDFPNSVRGVILEYYGSIPAFSPVANGEINRPAVASAKAAVRTALQGNDYSQGATFFFNAKLTSPSNWIRSRTVTTVIGNHIFAK